MTDLSDFEGIWPVIAMRYREGRLYKRVVVEALRSGALPPAYALPLLADMIEGAGKPLKQGRPRRDSLRSTKPRAASMVLDLERYITDPGSMPDDFPAETRAYIEQAHARTKYKRRDRMSARKQAEQVVAKAYGIGVRTLQTWMQDCRKNG